MLWRLFNFCLKTESRLRDAIPIVSKAQYTHNKKMEDRIRGKHTRDAERDLKKSQPTPLLSCNGIAGLVFGSEIHVISTSTIAIDAGKNTF
jgi:hypothetical protein